MRAHIYDENSLLSVSPSSLAGYLRADGWTVSERFGDHSDVYTRARSDGELIVPASSEIGDYASVMSRILGRLAAIEERDELQIFADLMIAGSDVIRVRAIGNADDGAIAIEDGVGLISQARDLVLSAACAAHEPRSAYRAGRNKEASKFMDSVKLGQTERGSYIVSLLNSVPLTMDDGAQKAFWPSISEEPFSRRVTRVLATALTEAQSAAEGVVRGAGLTAFRKVVPKGVSANLCEAIAGLIEKAGEAEVSITWARTRPAPEKRRQVLFRQEQAEIYREAARLFRSAEPKLDEVFEAFVVKLDRDEADERGRVTLRATIDGVPLSVRAEMDSLNYSVAIGAHDRRAPIWVRGDVVKKGERWWLDRLAEVAEVQIDEDVLPQAFE